MALPHRPTARRSLRRFAAAALGHLGRAVVALGATFVHAVPFVDVALVPARPPVRPLRPLA